MNKKKVSLVLGSGGARGLAHIGVIRWLIEHDFEIKSISGCSMGAVIGGFYVLGKLDGFEKWICEMTKLERFRLLDVTWSSGGLIEGKKIMKKLIDLGGDQAIENLSIPYTAVAVELVTGKEVWLDRGSLFDAIRASMSLPLIFTPAIINGRKLIDGACLNPVPVSPSLNDNTLLNNNIDFTIAVNLNGKIERHFTRRKETSRIDDEKLENKQKENQPSKNIINSIWETSLSKVSSSLADYGINSAVKTRRRLAPEIHFSNVALQAVDAMQSVIARHKLAGYPPDYTVVVPRDVCSTLDFEKTKEMISLGYKKAEEFLSRI